MSLSGRTRPSLSLLLLAGAPLVSVVGCGGQKEDPITLSVETDLGTATALVALDWPGVVVTPNLDDDDGDGENDYDQKRLDDGDDDYSEISILAPNGFDLSLSGEKVRVWYDNSTIVLSGDGDSIAFNGSSSPQRIQIEVGEFSAVATLSLTDQETGDVVELPITGAPLVLNHHVQPSEQVMAVVFNSFSYDNSDMIEDYEDVLGDRFLRVGGLTYGDPWIQDEIEFATSTGPTGRLDMVIDSTRDGQYGSGYGLDDFPEDEYLGPAWGVRTWGNRLGNGQDYFGNLEVSPPTTVAGVAYPYGRTYYGENGSYKPNDDLVDMLESQALQMPFTLDVSWLCVGHVDEFVTTVPAPGSRLGWKLVYSDVGAAWDVLEAMDPQTVLTRYEASSYKAWDTVGELVADDALRELNEELESDYLLPNLEIMKTELGLTDDDIILIPGLFEEVSGCYGTTAAAFPGMANLIVADADDGTPTLFVADPYLRTDVDDIATDPMAEAMLQAMPEELDVVFLDDWQVYHLNLGEVHCGSNVVRAPDEDLEWWVDARHLMEAK